MEEQLPPQDAIDTTWSDTGAQIYPSTSSANIMEEHDQPILHLDPTQGHTTPRTDSIPPSSAEDDDLGGNEPYKGMLWIKDKFEEYRLQADERMGALRIELDRRGGIIETLNEELVQAREKITDLSTKLEKNMSLLMNIHKELDKSLVTEPPAATAAEQPSEPPSTTPEAAHGGSGDQTENV